MGSHWRKYLLLHFLNPALSNSSSQLGLAAVPALPFMFDEPVEHAVEWVFHKAFSSVGGDAAVHGRPETGRSALSQIESKAGAAKEKEL